MTTLSVSGSSASSGFDPSTRTIRKRDGTTRQVFDTSKIANAMACAWKEVFGTRDTDALEPVVKSVLLTLPDGTVDVETVQDAVEIALMRHGYFAVAKAYILYRQKRAEARALRGKKPDPTAIRDYIHASKYARYRPELGRREVYAETVARVEDMHVERFPAMEREIREAFDLVREQRVLPSMRSMQFGGAAIESKNVRLFNCSFLHIDRLEAFSQAMYLLLCGCGVGYSVQFEHVEKLPPVGRVDKRKIRHHVVEDTIEGWADALKALLQSYQDGVYLEISYHKIRPAGTPLVTSGGRAPGHMKLKESLEYVRRVLDAAQGRKLFPIEAHRVVCHAADAVLSGGVRRSACLSLFSLDDSAMMNCKTGNWFAEEPWLANANNSVALKRDEVRKKQFLRIFEMTKQFGEPGFWFTNNLQYGCNPCGEISLDPTLVVDGKKLSGVSFCNLCEINAAKFASLDDFLRAAKAATLIGTLQASYTSMPYLGWVSEEIAKRDALLGISMTGMLDAPDVACNPEYQRIVAEKVKEWNREYARKIGIRSGARLTCIKPAGTSSLELGGVASGHHAHHARRYIRRVTADEYEFIFQEFKKINPQACLRKPDGKYVIEFPVEAPAGAIVKQDLNAIEFLEMVKSTQQHWVVPGTADATHSPGLTHNVSNTVHVRADEWDRVAEYLWENNAYFTGVSLLPETADKQYAFAPHEAIETEADEARWNTLLAHYKPVDYSSLVEQDDATNLQGEAACAGGACSVL